MSDLTSLKLSGSQRALFASDMHLGEHDAVTAAYFLDALRDALSAHRPSHLFLLGDLFERWVGDDQPDALGDALAGLLAQATQMGISVAVMRGNRDFLLGQAVPGALPGSGWLQRSGAGLLPDTLKLDLHGRITVLCHGDTLCTADTAYLAFRAMVRDPAWQQAFLARPLAERLAIAQDIRSRSEQTKGHSDARLMDAQEPAILALLQSAQATCLIHGHTHLPGEHPHALPGGREAIRHVLPDWQAPGAGVAGGARGYFLCADSQGLRKVTPRSGT